MSIQQQQEAGQALFGIIASGRLENVVQRRLVDIVGDSRDVNKSMHWELPIDGPKSVSGLIVEYLEHIPESPVCLRIGRYRIEIMQIKDNTIRSAKVTIDPNIRDDD